MKTILVTGAGGYLGRRVLHRLQRENYRLKVQVRKTDVAFGQPEETQLCLGDLRDSEFVEKCLDGVDTVVHLAAGKTGDLSTQFSNTNDSTTQLLRAMKKKGTRNLVLLSSFSVYNYSRENILIDEEAEIAPLTREASPYTLTKIYQEEQAQRFYFDTESASLSVLRPGLLYDSASGWNAYLGDRLGRYFIQVKSSSKIPLCHVDNCADAVALALSNMSPGKQIYNIIDDVLPTRNEAHRIFKDIAPEGTCFVALPWGFLKIAVKLFRLWGLMRGQKLKLPEWLEHDAANRRFGSFRYTNGSAKKFLKWQPRRNFSTSTKEFHDEKT